MVSRAETSRSVVVRVSVSELVSRSTPVRAGIPGLVDTPRWMVCSASDRSSRSHLNFTFPLTDQERLVRFFQPSGVGGCGTCGKTPTPPRVAGVSDTIEIRWTTGPCSRMGKRCPRRPTGFPPSVPRAHRAELLGELLDLAE